jgi:4-amino-4-deoxy-L-arabinose transferase-like glycosyltransferase
VRDTCSIRAVLLLATIAGLSLGVRLSLLRRPGVAWAMTGDAVGYVRLAEGLSTGCGFAPRFGNSCGPAELLRTPGYPLFLSVMPSLRTALFVQDALGAGVCLLIGLFAWRQWGLIAGVLAELLFGFDIPSIFWGNRVMSDMLFTSLITSVMLLQLVAIKKNTLERWTVAAIVGAGLLLGMAALVRPIAQVLIIEAPIPVLLLYRVSLQKRLVLILLTLCLPIIVVIAWPYRNYERRGVWTFSSDGALNLYIYTAGQALAYETARPLAEVQSDLLRSLPRIEDSNSLNSSGKTSPDWSKTFRVRPVHTGVEEEGWSSTFDADPAKMQQAAVRILLDHPWAVVVVTFEAFLKNCFWVERHELGTFLFDPSFDVGRAEAGLGIGRKLFATLAYPWLSFLILVEFTLLACAWAGVGMALARITHARFNSVGLILIPLCGALLLLAVAAFPATPQARYRVPAMPMLAIVAAFGWTGGAARRENDGRDDEF